jgi:hypothetical protein
LAELVLRPAGEYQDGAVEVLDAGYGVDGDPNESARAQSWT